MRACHSCIHLKHGCGGYYKCDKGHDICQECCRPYWVDDECEDREEDD